jgi:GR25 family glycosyltransferase involved in LPS biosynthesis
MIRQWNRRKRMLLRRRIRFRPRIQTRRTVQMRPAVGSQRTIQTQRIRTIRGGSRRVGAEIRRRPLAQGTTQFQRTPRGRIQKLPARYRQRFDINSYTSSIIDDLQKERQPTITSSSSLTWPAELTPIFAISMRAQRFNNLLIRMGPWSRHVELVPATDGRLISLRKWKFMGRLKTTLTNGQIGCYESHVRTWQKILDHNLPSALILEDDAAIVYSEDTTKRIQTFLGELKSLNGGWDIAYIGNIGLHPWRRKLSEHVAEMQNWEGLYTYYLSNAGARKLLQNAFPIEKAVDIFVGDQIRVGRIRALAMTPALNFVVPVQSDTDRKLKPES